MMPTKFSIIIDVLMVYIFMRRGLYSSQHKNIHPSASHYYGLFVFGKRATQNSRNITRAFHSLRLRRRRLPFSIFIIASEFPIAN
jgi:nicotinamide riboside transporter PnuC